MTAADATGLLVGRAAAAHAGPDPFLGPARGACDARTVAVEFAGLFYGMMIGEMQKTIPRNEYFGSRGEEIFRSLWVDELGRKMAGREGDPLTGMILSRIGRSQHNALDGAEKA